ncbi:hypothetical protein EPI10_023209 [Gossypium australe]|uniref:Uncharacterized protein n=1 Tax=Gossypium australe TaxID=47621 RepID=A0A5B6VUA5_9ROSI|nr:hypothetical protein EPI10_023209 [Gossypium australe]
MQWQTLSAKLQAHLKLRAQASLGALHLRAHLKLRVQPSCKLIKASFTPPPPFIFARENFHISVVKMKKICGKFFIQIENHHRCELIQ